MISNKMPLKIKMLSENYDKIPWVEKYRPHKMADIISQDQIRKTLSNSIETHTLQHLLFHGPPGCGKTATIMACAKQLYGNKMDLNIIVINASEERGIDIVRTRIMQFVTSQNVFSNDNIFRLVILDEVDAMTTDAQAILRKVIENMSSTTRFCLICNYVKKITPALQSRCASFRFKPLPHDAIKKKITQISKLENFKISSDAIELIIRISNGDMRYIFNTLQSACLLSVDKNLTLTTIIGCTGYIHPKHIDIIFNSLIKDKYNKSYELIMDIKTNNSYSLNHFFEEITIKLVDIIINDTKVLDINKILVILQHMSIIEMNLISCSNDDIQMAAFIGIFKL